MSKKICIEDCTIREVLDRVGDKWSMLLVMILQTGPKRYNELHHSIDNISQRILTLTLRNLERDGLITRTVTPTVPPRVDYSLSDLGHTLISPMLTLINWSEQHREAILAARQVFDNRTKMQGADRGK
ncbi:helix-turn-helix domain-containing protein [Chromatiaceae bacterium AAb-1]|nr:helix-turn-helix domain-containing protein [Chromatiaceae bacterium AAb-1]